MKISAELQVAIWVAGESLHNGDLKDPRSECCPDFSCCKPELLAPLHEREAFRDADRAGRNKLLGTFLGRLLAREFQGDPVRVVKDDGA